MDLDLDALRYEPLADRPSKVGLADLGRPSGAGPSLDDWLDGLPDLLAGRGLKRLRDAIVRAHAAGPPVVAALGGHVVKTGCAPYLIDWIERGVLNGLALNGSAAIHDLELAIAGRTSEDVGPRLMAGTFGFARETSELFAVGLRPRGRSRACGLGAALGRRGHRARRARASSRACWSPRGGAGIPLTVHVAIGTDIVHMTPRLDGAALGKATLDDFRGLCGPGRPDGRRGLAQPRQRGGPARGLPQGRRDRPQPRPVARRPDDRQPRLRPEIPRPAQRPPAPRRRGDRADGPPRADDPAAPRGGRRPARPRRPRRAMTIVVFCPNLIGDTVMATPAFRALRRGFPGATDRRRDQAAASRRRSTAAPGSTT